MRDQPHAQPFACPHALSPWQASPCSLALHLDTSGVSAPQCGTSPHFWRAPGPRFCPCYTLPTCVRSPFLLLHPARGLFASVRDQPLCHSHLSAFWSARVLSLGVHTLLAIPCALRCRPSAATLLALHAICTQHHCEPRLQRHARHHSTATILQCYTTLSVPLPPIRTLGLFA